MAINPPSDIVLDVARAADPQKLQMAAQKLMGAATVGASDADFADVIGGLDPSAESKTGNLPLTASLDLRNRLTAMTVQPPHASSVSDPAMKPYRNFEAFVLQSFIQSMLPKDADGIFGHGTAGEMWKSLLADQLGKQIAKAGGIGIAASIYKAHPATDGRPSAGGASATSHAHALRLDQAAARLAPDTQAHAADPPAAIGALVSGRMIEVEAPL